MMAKCLIGVSFGSQPTISLMPSDAPAIKQIRQTNAITCLLPCSQVAQRKYTSATTIILTRRITRFQSKNNALPIKDQASDAEVLKAVINETAKLFFDSWDTSIQEQQQYMRQNLFIGDSKPLVFIERLKRMNKMLQYFPRANVFDEDNVFIEEEQLISIVHHASHGIMQLQIQCAGRTTNEFKTLEDLKVFFNQQHDCDMLEKCILDNNGKNNKNE
jgi:hypothetical protein